MPEVREVIRTRGSTLSCRIILTPRHGLFARQVAGYVKTRPCVVQSKERFIEKRLGEKELGNFKLKEKPYIHNGACQRHFDKSRVNKHRSMDYICAICPHRIIEGDYCDLYKIPRVLSDQVNGQRRRIVTCAGYCAAKVEDKGGFQFGQRL